MTEIEKIINEALYDMYAYGEGGASANVADKIVDKCMVGVKKLIIPYVGSCCVDEETLIKELDDKRIVGTTLNDDMWRYCRKETAQHLLDKYNIIPK